MSKIDKVLVRVKKGIRSVLLLGGMVGVISGITMGLVLIVSNVFGMRYRDYPFSEIIGSSIGISIMVFVCIVVMALVLTIIDVYID